ncbi:response regulator transcription factor [Verrucomicrobiales bacterium BCK34]|nr:response regulator transcription factor [Verrucomicrobiales bacterium BCK34]
MKILIAEDDPVTGDSIRKILAMEGFSPVLARDGEEALKLWAEDRPDLVCLDIMMPKKDGFSVCREIRAEDANTPVLFLSAKNEEVDVVVGLELGADDFIRKPFGKHELVARIRRALRRTTAKTEAVDLFEMGHLKVFPKQLRATVEDREIELTPREVAILKVLSDRVNEAVSRDDLLDECWGMDYFPESRTLDQHISKLRHKIELDPESPTLIETVRGVGYRWRRS